MIAKYLEAAGPGSARGAKKGTPPKRATKGEGKGKAGEKKPDGAVTLPGDNKPAEAVKPAEPKAAEPKAAEPKPAETKPAESAKAE